MTSKKTPQSGFSLTSTHTSNVDIGKGIIAELSLDPNEGAKEAIAHWNKAARNGSSFASENLKRLQHLHPDLASELGIKPAKVATHQPENANFLEKARKHLQQVETEDQRDRVLIIDSFATRFTLKNIINSHGLSGIFATNESEITQHLQHHRPPKVIIIHAQAGDTLKIMAEIKANPTTKHTPIVISSPELTKEDVQRYIKEGASQFIVLPLNEHKVSRLVVDIKEKKLKGM